MDIGDVLAEIGHSLARFIKRAIPILMGYEILAFIVGVAVAYIGHQNSVNANDGTNFPVEPLSSYLIRSLAIAMGAVPLGVFLIIISSILFWFPSTIAKKRGHGYLVMIQGLNIMALFTGITWFIALFWAIFPSEKSLIDPIVGNVTGLGRRTAGDTIGSAKHGVTRGANFEISTDQQIDKLIDMLSKGLISEEEFARKKRAIIQRSY